MRFLIIFLFLFVFGCSGGLNKSEKIYICGDHPCANKNEAEEYFCDYVHKTLKGNILQAKIIKKQLFRLSKFLNE